MKRLVLLSLVAAVLCSLSGCDFKTKAERQAELVEQGVVVPGGEG